MESHYSVVNIRKEAPSGIGISVRIVLKELRIICHWRVRLKTNFVDIVAYMSRRSKGED